MSNRSGWNKKFAEVLRATKNASKAERRDALREAGREWRESHGSVSRVRRNPKGNNMLLWAGLLVGGYFLFTNMGGLSGLNLGGMLPSAAPDTEQKP